MKLRFKLRLPNSDDFAPHKRQHCVIVAGDGFGVAREGRLLVGGLCYQRAVEEADSLNKKAKDVCNLN